MVATNPNPAALPAFTATHGVRALSWLAATPWQAFIGYLPVHLLLAAASYAISDPLHGAPTAWPANGLLFSALLLLPRSRWFAIVSAAFIVECALRIGDAGLMQLHADPLWLWLAPAANVFETWLAAATLRQFQPDQRQPPSKRTLPLALCAVLGAATLSSALIAAFAAWRLDQDYLSRFTSWWLGDVLGIVLIAPTVLLYWWSRHSFEDPTAAGRAEQLLVAVLVLVAPLLLPLAGQYLVAAVLMYACLRLPLRQAAAMATGYALMSCLLYAHPELRLRLVTPAGSSLQSLQLLLLALTLTVLAIGAMARDLRVQNDRLRRHARQLQQLEEDTRRGAGEDLHDGIGQLLVAVRLHLHHLRRLVAHNPVLAREVDEASSLVATTHTTTRGLLAELLPPALNAHGLAAAADILATRMQREFGLQVILDCQDPGSLPPALRSTAYRCLRELLINSAKHSGQSSARVRISTQGTSFVIDVADDGQGFDSTAALDPARSGRMGLRMVQDRLLTVGGELIIHSAPGAGARMRIRLPLEDQAEDVDQRASTAARVVTSA